MDYADAIINQWIEQLQQPDVREAVRAHGTKRRIDLTLYSDRGKTPRPPSWVVK